MTELTPQLISTIGAWVRDITLSGAAVFILIGGYRGWWVWGYQYREMRADRDEWKTRALKSDTLIEWAVALAEDYRKSRQRP